MKWLLAGFALLILLLTLFATLASGPVEIANQPAPVKAPPVMLFCEDCAAAGMAINLWDAPGGRVTGHVPHNTPAQQLERRTIDGKAYVRVRTDSGQTGWLAASLVRSR